MRVANLAMDEEWTIQFDMALLKNGIPLTLTLTNAGGRTYFHGQNWMNIATELRMQAGRSFLLFLHEFEEGHPSGNKIYLWYGVPQSP